MSQEGAPKPIHATDKERELLDSVYEVADPTTFSALPPRGDHVELGTVRELGESSVYNNRVIERDGEIWYELKDENYPARQQAAARLLKGILNVADVVNSNGTFFSKRMAHEKIQERLSMEQVMADLELLNLILDDADHSTMIHDTPMYDKKSSGHNLRIEEGTATYHDFDQSLFSGWDVKIRHALHDEGWARLKMNLEKLKERYVSEEGKDLALSIYTDAEKADERSFKRDFDGFYLLLTKRIEKGLELVDTIIEQAEKRVA